MTDTTAGEARVYVEVSGLTGTGKSAVMGEIEVALRALGLPVEHDAAFQGEKNATHAEWQDALDLYKPTVVLSERNISLAAQPSAGAQGEPSLTPNDIAYIIEQHADADYEGLHNASQLAEKIYRSLCEATPAQPDTGDVAALREASIPVSAIVAFDVEEYVDGYELRADEGAYIPTEHEQRGLITDAIHGVLSEVTMLKGGSGGLASGVAALQDLLTATKINCDGEPESVAFASGVIEAYETFRLAALSKPNAPGREG